LLLPTAFTPNNDYLNDVFRVKYPFLVKQFKMRIYNRFGNLVFETDNMMRGWDGSYKGQLLPSGNYVWNVFTEDLSGKAETSNGSVILIR
jgi:gliding motility-associated-like protein